jgi:hypothetical protein
LHIAVIHHHQPAIVGLIFCPINVVHQKTGALGVFHVSSIKSSAGKEQSHWKD